MKNLSDDQAQDWCAERGIQVGMSDPSHLRFSGARELRFRVPVPNEATAAVALAYVIVMTGVEDYEEDKFNGAMVWLTRWVIWSESIDRVGYEFMGGPAAMDRGPARVFADGEFVGAQASLSLPMLFQWDALFVPNTADWAAFVSHNGWLDFVARENDYAALLSRFQDWGPEEL